MEHETLNKIVIGDIVEIVNKKLPIYFERYGKVIDIVYGKYKTVLYFITFHDVIRRAYWTDSDVPGFFNVPFERSDIDIIPKGLHVKDLPEGYLARYNRETYDWNRLKLIEKTESHIIDETKIVHLGDLVLINKNAIEKDLQAKVIAIDIMERSVKVSLCDDSALLFWISFEDIKFVTK